MTTSYITHSLGLFQGTSILFQIWVLSEAACVEACIDVIDETREASACPKLEDMYVFEDV